MIIEPNVNVLMKKENMDSRYTLVVAAAKRARELAKKDPEIDKTVTKAVWDIANDKVKVIPVPEDELEKMEEDEQEKLIEAVEK